MIKSDASSYGRKTTGTRSDATRHGNMSAKVSRMSLIYTNTNTAVGLYNTIVFGVLHVDM